MVLINFTETTVSYPHPHGMAIERTLIDNTGRATAASGSVEVELAPWQATVYSLGGD